MSPDFACESRQNWVAYEGSFSGKCEREGITGSFAPVLETPQPKLVPLSGDLARAVSDDGKMAEFRFKGSSMFWNRANQTTGRRFLACVEQTQPRSSKSMNIDPSVSTDLSYFKV